MAGALDAEHRRRLNALDIGVPEGQPVRWALNSLFRAGLPERVYGSELTLRVCRMAAVEGCAVAFYDIRQEVLNDSRGSLPRQCPTLRITAMTPSRVRRIDHEEQVALAASLTTSGAQIVFVGLGCPRRKVWLYEQGELLRVPQLALGAAFDFHAGRLPHAPAWMRKRGLEWLFRVASEPKRLWRRYLFLNPLFLAMLLLQATGLRPAAEGDGEPDRRYEGYA